MAELNSLKIVDFKKYCQLCEHKNDDDTYPDSPCYDCMEEPVNEYSRKPVNFKEKGS